MIASLRGILSYKSVSYIIVDVHGLGYGIDIPLSTFYQLPESGQEVFLYIYTHVKEDSLKLFGFKELREKEYFKCLLTVSGIGPKLAAAILSGISVDDLIMALAGEDVKKLTSVPGLGKKMAERMILELRDKIGKLGNTKAVSKSNNDQTKDDALSALENLGYKTKDAQKVIDTVVEKSDKEISLKDLLTAALKIIST